MTPSPLSIPMGPALGAQWDLWSEQDTAGMGWGELRAAGTSESISQDPGCL